MAGCPSEETTTTIIYREEYWKVTLYLLAGEELSASIAEFLPIPEDIIVTNVKTSNFTVITVWSECWTFGFHKGDFRK